MSVEDTEFEIVPSMIRDGAAKLFEQGALSGLSATESAILWEKFEELLRSFCVDLKDGRDSWSVS